MQTPARRVVLLAFSLVVAGCASRPLPKYEKPLARSQFQTIRTTAYTHTEGDHLQYSNRNACGDSLMSGPLKSAACDWSRWPVGTVFRIQETGETYVVDDYGWALAGRNTIDLYKPSRSAMNAWGVRRVNIEILKWGDARRSLSILEPRSRYAHVRRMVTDLRRRYADISKPMELAAAAAPMPEAGAEPVVVESAPPPRAVALANPQRPTGGFTPASAGRPRLTPFTTSGGQ